MLLVTLVLVTGGALAMDAAESGGRGPIEGFPDALWWAVSTMTTVGYGDAYPVTPLGRGIAVVLMVAGIAFFGVLTANLAAFLLDRTSLGERSARRGADDDVVARLDEVVARLAAVEALLPPRSDGS